MASQFQVVSLSIGRELAGDVDLTLSRARYLHRPERTVEDASAAIAAGWPHLLLLDTGVGRNAVIRLIDEATARGRIGVVALTRSRDLGEEMAVFEHGADDYVRVPVAPEELAARIGAVLRRTHGDARTPRVLVGQLEIDVLNRTVRAHGRTLRLTSLEQAVLYLLASDAGSVFSRGQIANALWAKDPAIEDNAIARHVRSLRAKLHDDWHRPRFIETVRGAGYRLVPSAGAATG